MRHKGLPSSVAAPFYLFRCRRGNAALSIRSGQRRVSDDGWTFGRCDLSKQVR